MKVIRPRPTRRRRRELAAIGLIVSLIGSVALAQPPNPMRPPVAATPAPASPVVQGYPVAGDSAAIATQLKLQYAGQGNINIAADPRTGQVVVIAPPEVQQQIARWLAAQAAAPPAALLQAPAAPQRIATVAWQLKSITWKDFENRLVRSFGSRLEASQDAVGDIATFRLPATNAGSVSLVVDRRTSLVTVAAPEPSAQAWLRIVQAIDARPRTADEQTSIVPLDRAEPETIKRTIELLGAAAGRAGTRRKEHIGQFVSTLFQQEGQPPANQPPAGNQPPPGGQAPQNGQPPPAGQPQVEVVPDGGAAAPSQSTLEAIARIGNVRIEILDDVIVVTGRQRDVERVLEIIEQIEQQSIETRPEVELYHLKHVSSVALSDMITQVYADVFSRIGRVAVVPLARPNAVLLIGRRENIPAVVELIQKLDIPAPMGAELKIFHLKHMSAIDAERTIRQFFVERPGFGTDPRTALDARVQVIAEYRANALIVQAAPRDMREVERILNNLDIDTNPTKQEVKVFKLRNALAEELAPILQEAITGLGPGGQPFQQQQQQQQGGQAGQGQSSPAMAQRPSISLQFLQLGPDGQRLIESGILANMRITADPSGNQLIVVGPASTMALMEALINQLDGLPAVGAQVKVFTLTNSDANSQAEMLQNLFGALQQGAGQGGGLAQSVTGAGETTLVPLRFSVDQRTNSIIASGNPGDLEVVYQILTRLDQSDIRQRLTTVYRLRNAPAADVADTLSGPAGLMTLQRQLYTAAPELVTPYELIEREVIVVAEEVTNSLVISATPRYYEEVLRVIEQLDRRPPMVIIQVVIAEVRLGDIDQFGLEWGLQDSLLFDRGIPPAAGGALVPGYNFNNQPLGNQNSAPSLATRENVAAQTLTNFALGRVDPTLGFGGLVLSASNESVSVLLRALEQSQRIQVISRPQVQTLDNQPAFVQVGALVPRITNSTITQFGVTNTPTDFPVGIILGVTPRTSPDGMIVMEINAEKSEVGPESEGIVISVDQNGNAVRSPQILITTAQTTVSARTGQTVILGGLITKSQTEVTRRVPYVADIPVLGRLFRFDSVIQDRSELLIIMTPYIVENDEQIDWHNQRESERMSWCIADVVNIHGSVPLSGNPAFNHGETELIFPDAYPAGTPPATLPGGTLPDLQPPANPEPTHLGPPIVEQSLRRVPPTGPPPTLVPQTIEPAVPPAGTQVRLQPLVPLGPAAPQVAPATYVQPVVR